MNVRPFLKWAGGKRWLVAKGLPCPKNFTRLVEPFVGSAAVFFHLRPARALLCDINRELINLYQVIRNNPLEIQEKLLIHHNFHSKDYYYKIRALTDGDKIERAARMLYLNRTCWNGLYRVNKKGQFNVPIGTKTEVILRDEKMTDYAKILKVAKFKIQDFEVTIDECGIGDFLFVDPPYTVKHNANGFVKYNDQIFSWDDQSRLAEALRRASDRGVYIVLTNADHDSVRSLYQGKFEYISLQRSSVLAAASANRGYTTEAVFTSNLRV